MKTANVFQIEKALEQPITPQQRQQAAANNPIAALIAQRLNGVEGSLRTKMQTPPPPQGTVMNQYMGLAQPGLEEMAQQYAAGGLVAFANGGLASMVPMGYGGEGDVPDFSAVRGFSGEDGSYVGAGPGNVLGYGFDKLKSLGSALGDFAFIKDPNWESWKNETEEERDLRKQKEEYESIHPPVEDTLLGKAGRIKDAFSELLHGKEVTPDTTVPPTAGSSKEKAVESKPAEEGPGVSVLPPDAYRPASFREPGVPNTSTPNAEPTVVITDEERQEAPHPAVMAPETGRIASSGLSAEKQIAEYEKLFGVDTTEAMKIKADWEKANARAGNLGILSALAGAVGLGLGTYGPQSHRIGAGLVGLASGLASNEQQQAARQEKLDNLKMKIAEMEQSPHKKAVETIATEKAKAAAREEKLRDDIQLEIAKGNVRKGVDAAKAAGKGTDSYKQAQIEKMAVDAAQTFIKTNYLEQGKRPPAGLFEQLRDKFLSQYSANPPQENAIPTASPTRSIGRYVGGQFTAS